LALPQLHKNMLGRYTSNLEVLMQQLLLLLLQLLLLLLLLLL
jgi:hypothetical protein